MPMTPAEALAAGEAADLRARLREAEEIGVSNREAISVHEKVCGERYLALDLRFKGVIARINALIAMLALLAAADLFGWRTALMALFKLGVP